MRFVGPVRHVQSYDLAAQRERLAFLHDGVRMMLDGQDWRLGRVPQGCLKVSLKVTTTSLDWSLELDIERARERLLDEHDAPYFWERSPEATAIESALAELDRDVERLRAVIGRVSDDATNFCRKALIPGLEPTWYPSLDGKISCSYSFHLQASAGTLVCPNCQETSFDNERLLNRWGVPCCPYCDAIFTNPRNRDLPIADGVRLLQPGEVPDQAVREALREATQDDRRFNQYGPFDDWKKGSLRIYVAVVGGRVVGFSTWNNLSNGTPTLRIVWVNKAFRRRGFGRSLLDMEAAKANRFAVESPSDDFHALIESTGYLQSKDVRMVQGG